jgi:hypothetical protein
VVVVDGAAISFVMPVPIGVPPQLPANHDKVVPDPPSAFRVIVEYAPGQK